MKLTLDHLRSFAVRRSLFAPTTLERALQKMEFVQADPIRSPARAQDLILRHRVRNYHAGDLERRYAQLDIEEDFFIPYGFVTRRVESLMHPRSQLGPRWNAARRKKAELLLAFVRERTEAHPRDVDAHFAHGTVTNYWGGSSNATTHLLDFMHYAGMLRIARREKGIRIYAEHQHAEPELSREARLDELVDVIVRLYAPLTARGLSIFVRLLRFAAPQWSKHLTAAIRRAQERCAHAHVDGTHWYWPADETPTRREPEEKVRLLAPFDPIVRDRARFEIFWGWQYRFEAYTPAPKRKLGYYALPLLWRDQIVGWGNLAVKGGKLQAQFGYVAGSPSADAGFARELEAELARMREFLRLKA